MSDDTPTERFTAAKPEEGTVTGAEERKSRKLVVILLAGVGALLLTVLIVLLTRGDSYPSSFPSASPSGSASPTSIAPSPSPTPSPTPTQTDVAPPPSTEATINSFSAGTTEVRCNSDAPGGPFPMYLNISWSSSNVDRVYFGVDGGDDASAGPLFDNLPPSGDSSDFPSAYYPFEFGCGGISHKYTLTVIGSDGSKDSRSIVVQNTGDTG